MFKQLRKHNNKYNTTMNIDDKLKNLKPSDTPLLVIGYIILGMFLLIPLSHANDNEVLLDQEGDNVVIDIAQGGNDNKVDVKLGLVTGDTYNMFSAVQIGNDNSVYFSVGGNNNDIHLVQEGKNNDIGWTDSWGSGYSWGGDLDGNNNDIEIRQKCSFSTCNANDVQFHIQGNNNDVLFGQGYYLSSTDDTTFDYDNYEPGGNFLRLDIHGSNNDFSGSQKMDSSGTNHSMTVNLYSNSNDVFAQQWANGNKTLTLTTNNDSNIVDIEQKGSGAHSATVVLNGSYSTTLDLLQQGTTAQGYSLTQTCATLGGCSISVTQE
tara:strand:- start:468 stop:1427 length:960 start_codon:yes stop_codon:yes gene_type:complete